MTITELVKKLRELTGSGMMDCKKAIEEAKGVFDEAVQILRKKGLASAAKKTSRIAAEGVVSIAINSGRAIAIEVNSETDFVARNDKFQTLVQNISNAALKCDSVDGLNLAKMPSGQTVAQEIAENISIIGENITLRRFDYINNAEEGIIGIYIHNKIVDNIGKIAVLVELISKAKDKEKLNLLGKQIAMHIAATKPISVSIDLVNPDLVQKEKEIAVDRAKNSGKPENIVSKMVESQMKKFYEDNVLLEQMFVIDNKIKISDLLISKSKELESDIKIGKFIRFEVGENIVKKKVDFADEVSSIING